MGREFELKFRSSREALDALEQDYRDFTKIAMETTYYDTPEGALSSRHWTLRRRFENGKSVCTLKTPAENGGRSEWEVECDDIRAGIQMLCKLGGSQELLSLTAGGVIPVCGARFTRLAKTIALENATVELALDRGCLLGGGRETPLLEVEVEAKAGSEEEAMLFARALAARYGLTAEHKSKYRRALTLAQGET